MKLFGLGLNLYVYTVKPFFKRPFIFAIDRWLLIAESHRIGSNRECRVLNNFSFSIAKINVFDCQNRYNGNQKCII